MRKVKVVAGVFCILALSALGVIADGETCAPELSGEMLYVLESPVTAEASIETTTTATTAKLTAAVSPETSAAETTASVLLTETSQTTTAGASETTVTTTGTEETDAPESTEAEEAGEDDDAVIEESDDEPDEDGASEEDMNSTEATELPELTEENAEEPTATELDEAEESEQETEEPSKAITVTEEEYIMLCNVVGHEYGANWISEYDKALVVEVIMNRVNSSKFPNTIYEVLMQKGQFPGLSKLINLGRFSKQVTQSVKDAVDLYLSDPSQFQHGYLFYSGDGHRNYFRKKA